MADILDKLRDACRGNQLDSAALPDAVFAIDRLRFALRQYGAHARGCAKPTGICNCGYEAALYL